MHSCRRRKNKNKHHHRRHHHHQIITKLMCECVYVRCSVLQFNESFRLEEKRKVAMKKRLKEKRQISSQFRSRLFFFCSFVRSWFYFCAHTHSARTAIYFRDKTYVLSACVRVCVCAVLITLFLITTHDCWLESEPECEQENDQMKTANKIKEIRTQGERRRETHTHAEREKKNLSLRVNGAAQRKRVHIHV